MLRDVGPYLMLFVWLGDVAATELDQDAVAQIVPRRLKHGQVVHTQLLTVIADFDLECIGIELGCQCLPEVRRHNTMSMVAHEGLETLAESLQTTA